MNHSGSATLGKSTVSLDLCPLVFFCMNPPDVDDSVEFDSPR